MADRSHCELTEKNIARITDTYHAWRGDKDAGEYAAQPGFCKSATINEAQKHSHVLTPGRYVGASPQENDAELFAEKMQRLVAALRAQQVEAARLDASIVANLQASGFGAECL